MSLARQYNKYNLGAGSIGGRGWWLVKECRFNLYDYLWHPTTWGEEYNTNLTTDRPVAEACTFNEKLPFVGPTPLGRLEFYLNSMSRPALNMLSRIVLGAEYPLIYHRIETVDETDALYGRFNPVGLGDNNQRHAHRVLLNNITGTSLLDVAVRIQVGESGYTDTLPGLFVLEPVSGSVVPGVSCKVTISQYSNHFFYWQDGNTSIHCNNFFNYGSTDHPYLRSSSTAITVDLSVGNHNKHVLPGIDLQFNPTVTEGSKSVVSIGYEYCNRWSEVGDLGTISGRTDYYSPMSAYGLVPSNGAVSSTSLKNYLYKWKIYNVTGDLQEGCQFHVRPLVRLDQGNSIVPFDQWFMGHANECSLPKSESPYFLSFSNLQLGSPNVVTLRCNRTVSMLVKEIDASTYQPTGTNHSDASGLKCDGQTLYLWDALGIYFVLSPQTDLSHRASVWVKHGDNIERRVRLDSDHSGNDYDLITPPYSMSIGGWNAITDDDQNQYPVSPFAEEQYFTGSIQTQGFDYAFFNADVHATQHHWQNHDVEVAVYPGLTGGYYYGGMREFCVMVTCDDPRYFQVVPMTFIPTDDRAGLGATGLNMRGSAQIATPSPGVSIKGSTNLMKVRRDLALRVNQLPPGLRELLADHGVTIT